MVRTVGLWLLSGSLVAGFRNCLPRLAGFKNRKLARKSRLRDWRLPVWSVAGWQVSKWEIRIFLKGQDFLIST